MHFPRLLRRSLAAATSVLLAVLSAPPALAEEPLTLTREQLIELIDQRVEERLRSDELLQSRIERGIEEFVRKQRQAAAERQQRESTAAARNVRPFDPERDHVYGAADAKITLFEYSDFECPFCKRFHPTAKALVDGSNGLVNLVYRHFPLSFHNPGAQKQAEGAECAAELGGTQAFWQFTDRIYERTRSNGDGFPLSNLAPLAEEIGLDRDRFRDCLESGRMAARVDEDFEEGKSVGITGTPGNILRNNRSGEVMVAAGALPLQNLVRMVDQLRDR